MAVNNENGAHFPIDRIVPAVRKALAADALIHCDAVQAGKAPISVKKLDIDLRTASSHKLHGPKGCGMLYIKKGVRVLPRVFEANMKGDCAPEQRHRL